MVVFYCEVGWLCLSGIPDVPTVYRPTLVHINALNAVNNILLNKKNVWLLRAYRLYTAIIIILETWNMPENRENC